MLCGILLLIYGAVWQDVELSSAEQKVVEKWWSSKKSYVERLKESIERDRDKVRADKKTPASRKKASEPHRLQPLIDKLENAVPTSEYLDLDDPRVGDYGRINSIHRLRVRRIDGPDKMLVTSLRDRGVNKVPLLLVVRGVSTDGLADDQILKLSGVLAITGTERDQAGDGSTSFVVDPIDESHIPEIQRRIRTSGQIQAEKKK